MCIVWALPVNENREYISANVKYHCFEDGKSLCGNYMHDSDCYKTSIESGEILMFPICACKKCFKKWKREFNI